jgi:hypothetical protein
VGAASSGGDGVESAVEKSDVGYPLQVAFRGKRRWKSGGNGGAVAGLVEFRDSACAATEIGTDGRENLNVRADLHGRDGSARTCFSDVEITVGAEFDTARRLESRGVDGCVGRKLGINRRGSYTGGGRGEAEKSD